MRQPFKMLHVHTQRCSVCEPARVNAECQSGAQGALRARTARPGAVPKPTAARVAHELLILAAHEHNCTASNAQHLARGCTHHHRPRFLTSARRLTPRAGDSSAPRSSTRCNDVFAELCTFRRSSSALKEAAEIV